MTSQTSAAAGDRTDASIVAAARPVDLRTILDIWYRRRWLVLSLIVLTLLGTEFGSWVVYPAFESRVEILIGAQMGFEIPFSRDSIAFKKSEITETQSKILVSRPNLEHAVRVMGLDTRPKYPDGLRGRLHRLKDDVLDFARDAYQSVKRWAVVSVLGGVYKPPRKPTEFEAAVGALEETSVVKVEPISNTDILVLTMRDREPETAAGVANALSGNFLAMELDSRRQRARQIQKSIEDRLAAVGPEFAAARRALARFKEEHRVADIAKEIDAALVTLSMLETTYWDVSQKESARALNAWEAERRETTASRDLDLRGKTALMDKLAELAEAQARYRPDHPKVQAARAAVEEIRRELGELPAPGESPPPASAASAAPEQMRDALGTRIEGLRRQVSELTRLDSEYQTLVWDQEHKGDLLNFLERKREDALTAEQTTQAQARIIEPAVASYRPAWPPKWLYRGLALLTAMVVSVALCAILERLDDTIRRPEAAARLVGLPTLGSIPFVPR